MMERDSSRNSKPAAHCESTNDGMDMMDQLIHIVSTCSNQLATVNEQLERLAEGIIITREIK